MNRSPDRVGIAAVRNLLERFGWRDIIDLGDLLACRAMARLAPMWNRLNDRLCHVWFNLALVDG